MVLKEHFTKHLDKIRGYDNLQQHIDSLTGSIRGIKSNQSGNVEFDIYPMVIEMLRALDDCIDTPYVDVINWTMSKKMFDRPDCTPRLIEIWATEFEYGLRPKEIFDFDLGRSIYIETTNDLYDYLFLHLIPQERK